MAFKLTSSGQLKQKLEELKQKFMGKVISAKITVPDELKWWYYQEHGTAAPYEIDPVNAKALRLPATAAHPEEISVPHVGPPYTDLHPPIAAKHMVERVKDEIVAHLCAAVTEVPDHYEPEAYHSALLDNTMPYAVDKIAESFDEQLPGTEPDGRLSGESAGEAFAAGAEIVDQSS